MKYILLLLLFPFSNSVIAQDGATIDKTVAAYPAFSSPEKLADRIKSDFTTDADKARAIFGWIAQNVSYDVELYKEMKGGNNISYHYKSQEEKVQKERAIRYEMAKNTLRTKTGVCEHYTALFHILCEFTGLPVQSIPGASRTMLEQIGDLPGRDDHIWNAVKIGDAWKLVDATWGAGITNGATGKFERDFNDGWFATHPEVFALSHYPRVKEQAMTEITPESYAANPLFYGPYMKYGIELLGPDDGVLKIAKPTIIPFEFKNVPPKAKVGYAFSYDNRLIPAVVKRVGDTVKFDVKVDKIGRGYLFITLDGKYMIAYKLMK